MQRPILPYKSRAIFFKQGVVEICEPPQEEKCSICRWYLAESSTTPCIYNNRLVSAQEVPRKNDLNQNVPTQEEPDQGRDDNDDDAVIAIKACKHMYHKGCLKSVLTDNGDGGESICPLCRVKLYRGTGFEDRAAASLDKLYRIMLSLEKLEKDRRSFRSRVSAARLMGLRASDISGSGQGGETLLGGNTFEELKRKTAELRGKIQRAVARARALVKDIVRNTKGGEFDSRRFDVIQSALEEGWSEELGQKMQDHLAGIRNEVQKAMNKYLEGMLQ